MNRPDPAGVQNVITGGLFQGPVLQGGTIHATFQLAVPAPVALAQLPPPAAAFTGRDNELAVLAGQLDPRGPAAAGVALAIAGLAGVGKTTLAVQAGHAAVQRGWFGGGVLFLDLHGYDGARVAPAQALDSLLRALGVPAEHIPLTAEDRAGLYRSVLAQAAGPVLVIADNASSEAQVRPLLPGAGPHKLLVTSRHTLAALGARLVDVGVLDEEASAPLLDAALRTARPGDDRISRDPDAARRLATICGGLPLALQISAALLTADLDLTAAEFAGQLADEQQRMERLVYDDGSTVGAPSVAAAFELSYRRLDDASARMLRLLPVNPGPDISTAAAAALAGLPVGEARTVLVTLRRAHLAGTVAGTGRWQMHDLVRLYAQRLSEQSAEADSREQARDRLLSYYTSGAEAAEAHLKTRAGQAAPELFASRDDALAWLDAERASVIAAVSMAAAAGRDQVALRLPLALAEYLSWRRRLDDWMAVTEVSLATARRLGERHSEGTALNCLGVALRYARRFDQAAAAHHQAATAFRDIGDRHNEAGALINLGSVLGELRKLDEAAAASRQAAAVFREVGDRHAEAVALTNLGGVLLEAGALGEAVSVGRAAAAKYRETGDERGEGKALSTVGWALGELGRLDEAIGACWQAVAILRQVGDRATESIALDGLSGALRSAGRFQEAIAASEESLAICRQTGDRHGEAVALFSLGLVLPELGWVNEAVTMFREAAALFDVTGDKRLEHEARSILARISASRRR